MEVNEIKVVYAWPIFIKKKAHLLQVTADVEEVVVIKRRDGKMNVDALKGLADPRNIPQIGDEEKFDEARRVHIDTLTLSVKRVVYKDYTAGEKPDIEVYDVRIENKNYKDIPGVQMLFLFMLKEAMAKVARAATDAGKWCGCIAVDGPSLQTVKAMGYQLIVGGADIGFLRTAAAQKLESLREADTKKSSEKGGGVY